MEIIFCYDSKDISSCHEKNLEQNKLILNKYKDKFLSGSKNKFLLNFSPIELGEI